MSYLLDQSIEELAAESPLARVYPASELPGLLWKRLVVPEGQVAVVARPGAPPISLRAGRRTVGTPASRFAGRLGRTVYALLPAEPFALLVTAPRLESDGRFVLTGDDQLIDVMAQTTLRVSRPARFFSRLVQPQGRVSGLSLGAVLAGMAAPHLGAAVAQYAAGDLNHPTVSSALAEVFSRKMAAPLADLGLELVDAPSVVARPAEETVVIAERAEALQARLREIAQSAEMDKLTRKAELLEYARQQEADFGVTGLSQAAEAEAPAEAPAGWLGGLTRRLVESRVAGELARAWQAAGKSAAESAGPATVIKSEPLWLRWLTPLRYLFSLSVILIFFDSMKDMAPDHPDYRIAVVRLLLYAGALLAGVVSSIWAEERVRRHALNRQVMGSLGLLSQGDRLRADKLLRRQVTTELDGLRAKLKDARFRVYREGDKPAAGRIKEMERGAERLGEELGQVDVGRAAYLTPAHVTPRELAAMLNYDESLMLQMNRIGDQTQALLAEAIAGDPVTETVKQLEGEMSDFAHRFNARSRFMRTPL